MDSTPVERIWSSVEISAIRCILPQKKTKEWLHLISYACEHPKGSLPAEGDGDTDKLARGFPCPSFCLCGGLKKQFN